MSPLDEPSDLTLLLRARAGTGEAWLTLVLAHGDRLRRLAELRLDPRLRGRMGPDDVVQEALTDAFRTLDRFFETSLPFSVWLRQRLMDRIRRIHRDHLETQKRGASMADPDTGWDDHLMDPGTSVSGRAMRSEHVRLLHSVIGKLDDIDRESLFLFFFEGYDHGEIGSILGLEPAASRKRLSRAISRLDHLLRRSHPGWCHAFESSIQHRPG